VDHWYRVVEAHRVAGREEGVGSWVVEPKVPAYHLAVYRVPWGTALGHLRFLGADPPVEDWDPHHWVVDRLEIDQAAVVAYRS
jgi:hypothetical protein